MKIQYELKAPELEIPSGGEGLSVEDMVDLLGDEKPVEGEVPPEEKKEKPKEKEEKEKKEGEEEDEEKELELEDTELEYKEIPKRQEILKAFPELFKKFPGIEHALYREKEFTDIFSSPQDAKEAQERITDLQNFEKSLLTDGTVSSVLKSVKETDKKAFDKITDNYLIQLREVDQQAYDTVLENVMKTAAITMFNSGKQVQNENLMAAAQIFAQWMFGTTNINLPTPKASQPNEQEEKLKEERAEFVKQKFDNALGDVSNRVQNVLKSNIDKYLDPKNVMTPYVRDKAKTDILEMIDTAIESDTRFKATLDKLWEQAADDDFSEASRNKIRMALLNKAKTVLPRTLQSVRSNALKGFSNVAKLKQEEPEEARGRSSSQNRPQSQDKNSVPKGMKTLDYLMSD